MKSSGPAGIPVVMYHGVGPEHPDWIWNHLVIPLDVFEGQMRMLRDEGWTAITLARLHDHMKTGAPLPEKPVVLTFDDGYLDNWVYAYPLLKKYGHRGVIWMTTDFIDPYAGRRPTIEDCWNGLMVEDDLRATGFLSWAEMKEMTASGHIEIQSHAKTHTWYFDGPEILDYHRPRGIEGYATPPWLFWNLFPGRKHEYMNLDIGKEIPYGTPIYSHGKSLSGKRYFEDRDLTGRLVRHVAENGGPEFFERHGWRSELDDLSKVAGEGGRMETDGEFERRVRDELAGSREILSSGLGTTIDFLCWPGGGIGPVARMIAREAGYLATTTHFWDPDRKNVFGQEPSEINRIGCCSPWLWKGRQITKRIDPAFFIATLDRFAGREGSAWKMRLFKMKYLMLYLLGFNRMRG